MKLPERYLSANICHSEESGVIMILFAMLLVAFLTIVVFTITLSDWTVRRTELQLAADTAASDASSTFCSTRACWNHALINALESIDRIGMRGASGRSSFRAQISTAIADLRTQISAGVANISGPGGQNSWLIDGLTIEISRGRWWQDGIFRNGVDSSGNSTRVRIAPASVDDSRLIPQDDLYSFSGATPTEPKFEPFDRLDGTNWQGETGNQGTPAFLAANSVYVQLSFRDYSPVLSLGIVTPAATIAVQSIAARLKDSPGLVFCAAPFAIPACSLLNNVGEYEPANACQFDRYFTGERRYCTQAELDAGTCNVLPGSWYTPLTEISCDSSKPWYSAEACECAQTVQEDCPRYFGPGESCPKPWVRGAAQQIPGMTNLVDNVPCGQKFGQNSMECTFNPWPKLTQVSDHYGVVGTSTTDIFSRDPLLESTYTFIMGGRLCVSATYDEMGRMTIEKVPNTVKMRIGERFEIKPDGLNQPATDVVVWDAIWGQMPLSPGDLPSKNMIHPKFFDFRNTYFGDQGFRELGYPWFMGRVDNVLGYPVGATKNFLDQILAQDPQPIRPYKNYGEVDPITGLDKPAIEPYECIKNNIPDFGACNSRRVQYNNRCHRKHRWYNPRPNQLSCNLDAPHSSSLWTNARGYCHPNGAVVQPDGTVGGPFIRATDEVRVGSDNFYQQWSDLYALAPTDTWTCNDTPPYMPCPISSVGGYPRGEEGAPSSFFDSLPEAHPADIGIWQVPIPVIANVSPTATPCTGINGNSGPDPQIKNTDEWRIIGFIRVNLFDNDIGRPPPAPPGAAWNVNSAGVQDVRVCEYGADADGNGVPDRYPWAFNPTYRPPPASDPTAPPVDMGAPQNCNMVRGRVACDPGLISGDYRGLVSEDKKAPAIVYTK